MNHNWVPHFGGPRPVDGGQSMYAKFRSGAISERMVAGSFDWEHRARAGDIVAYRLHKPCTPRWDGTSWPPPERSYVKSLGREFEILAIRDGHVIGYCVDGVAALKRHETTATGTAAVKSAEEEAVEAMREQQYQVNSGSGGMRGLYRAIAAGKIPGVRLED